MSDVRRTPFPDFRSKAGSRVFPGLVPTAAGMPGTKVARAAAAWWQTKFQGNALVACGVHGQLLGLPIMQQFAQVINGAPPVMEIREAGHFCQQQGEAVAQAFVAKYLSSPHSKGSA